MDSHANLYATVDLGAIAHNVGVLRDRSGADVIAVVKADGYAHGAVPVGRTALRAGAIALGVAQIREARALRAAGLDGHLIAWLHTTDADFAGAITDGIDIAVSSPRQLAAVVQAARGLGRTATVSVKLDTGLARSGVAPDEWDATAEAIAAASAEGAISLHGAMCHLAFGDVPEHPLNSLQGERLDEAVADLTRRGVTPELVHIANSPAALTRPDLARDAVRPGLSVYGYSPVPEIGDFGLIPAMTLETRISLIKRIPAGQGVSYNHTWVAPRNTFLGVVPAGYADGVPRGLSGRLGVHVNGRVFPSVGRICMDQLVIDLGPDGGGVAEGDRAILFGPACASAGEPVPTATDWADATGTIDYEIISRVGSRAVRRYVNDPAGESDE
ncbi:alanine racemase [Gordonia neofelifaecis]|uniref:Alanine racemase n=1 Tax=Gordonia neofelifaecis NRRL B-59395 TaxID=644548 RepID=F1YFJ1_9ACTN|nr:alanine racemase [Gordonia neofelifaecis]EGD56479.1 alanine racemase [Gordonia neofelifaecis NRRL B-59395]